MPQMGTADFNNCKNTEKTRFPPTTATHRHFFRVGEVLEPTVLMVILPTRFWVRVLVDKELWVKSTARKADTMLKSANSATHRQPPPFFNRCG